MMVAVWLNLGIRNPRGFGIEWAVTLCIALLPSVIYAFTTGERRPVLLYGTIHFVLMAGLALLYLVGAGTFGFVYALVIYFAAVVTSIFAVVDQ